MACSQPTFDFPPRRIVQQLLARHTTRLRPYPHAAAGGSARYFANCVLARQRKSRAHSGGLG